MNSSSPLNDSFSSSGSSLGDSSLNDSWLTDSVDLTPTTSPEKKKPEGWSIRSSFYNNGASLLSWGLNGVTSTAVSTGSYLGGAAVSTKNYVLDKAGKAVTSVVLGQLKQGVEDCEPISEEKEQTLKYLDVSGQLPKIINKYVHHQITPEFMKEIGGNAEDLQTYLKFMAKQAIASLACNRAEDYDNLPMNVIKNLLSIINMWIVKTGLQEKLRACRCLHVTTQKQIKELKKNYQEDYLLLSEKRVTKLNH